MTSLTSYQFLFKAYWENADFLLRCYKPRSLFNVAVEKTYINQMPKFLNSKSLDTAKNGNADSVGKATNNGGFLVTLQDTNLVTSMRISCKYGDVQTHKIELEDVLISKTLFQSFYEMLTAEPEIHDQCLIKVHIESGELDCFFNLLPRIDFRRPVDSLSEPVLSLYNLEECYNAVSVILARTDEIVHGTSNTSYSFVIKVDFKCIVFILQEVDRIYKIDRLYYAATEERVYFVLTLPPKRHLSSPCIFSDSRWDTLCINGIKDEWQNDCPSSPQTVSETENANSYNVNRAIQVCWELSSTKLSLVSDLFTSFDTLNGFGGGHSTIRRPLLSMQSEWTSWYLKPNNLTEDIFHLHSTFAPFAIVDNSNSTDT